LSKPYAPKKMPSVGEMIMFYPFADSNNKPMPMLVTSVNGVTVNGWVFYDNHSSCQKDVHCIKDPWCEDHGTILRKPNAGAWSNE